MADRVTWEDDIKHFFTQMDIGCMRSRPSAIDLADYESVKSKAAGILSQVKLRVTDPNRGMPKGGRAWPQERIDKFDAWMKDGFPRGGTTEPDTPTS